MCYIHGVEVPVLTLYCNKELRMQTLKCFDKLKKLLVQCAGQLVSCNAALNLNIFLQKVRDGAC